MSEMNTMKERNIQQLSVTQKIVKFGVKFGTYAFLIAMALIVLFPFYWMIISSLKNLEEYRQYLCQNKSHTLIRISYIYQASGLNHIYQY